eukprot:scaffold3874_cov153-Pinguiococcus_pyrenoidosus.AAC.2
MARSLHSDFQRSEVCIWLLSECSLDGAPRGIPWTVPRRAGSRCCPLLMALRRTAPHFELWEACLDVPAQGLAGVWPSELSCRHQSLLHDVLGGISESRSPLLDLLLCGLALPQRPPVGQSRAVLGGIPRAVRGECARPCEVLLLTSF